MSHHQQQAIASGAFAPPPRSRGIRIQCGKANCPRWATYAPVGCYASRCYEHRDNNMVDVVNLKRCIVQPPDSSHASMALYGLRENAEYGPTHCSMHKLAGMVRIR